MFNVVAECADFIDDIAGLLPQQFYVLPLIGRHVLQNPHWVFLEITERTGTLVDSHNEAFRLHGNGRDVRAKVEVAFAVRRCGQSVNLGIDTIPRFNADAGIGHKGSDGGESLKDK